MASAITLPFKYCSFYYAIVQCYMLLFRQLLPSEYIKEITPKQQKKRPAMGMRKLKLKQKQKQKEKEPEPEPEEEEKQLPNVLETKNADLIKLFSHHLYMIFLI